ncbi:hypothetical protein BH10PSE7_BH10PSE7_35990 [soil metagenome]
MAKAADSLPDDVETLKTTVIAAQVEARNAEAQSHALALQVEKMKFEIMRLRHEKYGQGSERSAGLEQFELQLAELEESASETETAGLSEILCLRRFSVMSAGSVL